MQGSPAPDAEDTDEALMLAYGAGRAGAFDVLYARHKGGVYRYLLRHCRNAGLADELFQDVWMNAIRARATYAPTARFTTWLYTLAHNRLVDHWRANGQAKFVSIDADPEDPDGGSARGLVEALPGARNDEPEVACADARARHRAPRCLARASAGTARRVPAPVRRRPVARRNRGADRRGRRDREEPAALCGREAAQRAGTAARGVDMTPGPELPERDPALERAWRAQSRETPPVELDRAILAAAHRAVGSGPREASQSPEAKQPQRWWMPLAAAATIGAVAVGLLQLTPQDADIVAPTERIAAVAPRQDAATSDRTTSATAAPPPAAPAPTTASAPAITQIPAAPADTARSDAARFDAEPADVARADALPPTPASEVAPR